MYRSVGSHHPERMGRLMQKRMACTIGVDHLHLLVMRARKMTNFIVRVELHDANYFDYENLHAAMARAGFSRTIRSDNGTVYYLPTAEYYMSNAGNALSVLKLARGAADAVGKTYGAIAAEAGATAWIGLQQAA